MNSRFHRLHTVVLALVVVYTLTVMKLLAVKVIISPYIDPIAVFLTSLAVYQLLTEIVYRLVVNNKLLLKLYWGREFLDGLWYYTYFREGKGADPAKVYFGIWRFEQNLFRTKIFGIGLTDDFRVRSRV